MHGSGRSKRSVLRVSLVIAGHDGNEQEASGQEDFQKSLIQLLF
jgi:hypothetical protein